MTPALTSHDVATLIDLFSQLFRDRYRTELVRGNQEPLYRPADESRPFHQVIFAHGYYSSALHEIAHWCVAGRKRRELEDFGYWYLPDGRNTSQQAAFEEVEVKPQALEWAFSVAANHPFRFSADNLNGEPHNMNAFRARVHAQVGRYFQAGFPRRAGQ